MNKLVLEIKKGGLGDHLFYSHIPRVAKESGAYEKVYLSSRSSLRSQDTRRLVWEANPYLDGFCDEIGIFPEEHPDLQLCDGENLLDRIMLLLGLDDGLRYHEPEVYYKPQRNPALDGVAVYDPNFISWVGDMKVGDLDYYLRQHGITIDFQMAIRRGPTGKAQRLSYQNLGLPFLVPELLTPTLEEFCSVIISCDKLYCLTTGTATLAAALGKPATVFHGMYHDKLYRHSRLHKYVLVPRKPLALPQRLFYGLRNRVIRLCQKLRA